VRTAAAIEDILTSSERVTESQPGRSFSVLSNPEFLAEGTAINDTRESPVIRICKVLLEEGAILQILDPKLNQQQIAQDLGQQSRHGEGSWQLVADVHQAASGADPLVTGAILIALLVVGVMAQLLVRQLDLAVKEALRRRAQRHGRSMEEEARVILARALASDHDADPETHGLGTRMAALFEDAGLEEPIGEWRGQAARPAGFEP
jgi:plasmid stability protein